MTDAVTSSEKCYHIHFGLIVTGETEEDHLPKLFRDVTTLASCNFEVIRRVRPFKAVTSKQGKTIKKQHLRIVGTNASIPDEREEALGIAARTYISRGNCHFVIVVDDLEHDGRLHEKETFARYRTTLDAFLKQQAQRASFHFLVNMLEAYYLADAKAINAVFGTTLADYAGDVEAIRNPKQDLKDLIPTFKEREHGGQILSRIDVLHVLSNPQTCASLRTLFLWCAKILDHVSYTTVNIPPELQNGLLSETTKDQHL